MRVLLILLLLVNSAVAQVLPPGFARVKVGNLIGGTAMAFAPDGRIFVTVQSGAVRIFKNEVLLATPFATFSVQNTGERGLLGIAFDPDFETNQYIYFYHTLPDGSRNRVIRVTADGDAMVPGSELMILELDPLGTHTNHNGGAIHFGPDGKLYVAVGENQVAPNAQNLDTNLGKILRINKDGTAPSDNPFPTGSVQRRQVWAYGMRNPYTFVFNRSGSKLFVNDVGGNQFEEINDVTNGGGNYGWPAEEGVVANSTKTNPVYAYGHGTGDGIGCAVTGGAFFDPIETTWPADYYGKYFFMDLCGAWINTLQDSVASSFATAMGVQVLGLTLGPDGNLYYLQRTNGGALFKITYSSTTAPVVTLQPKPMSVAAGGSVTLEVNATGEMPFQYQWYRHGEAIGGATSTTLMLNSFSADQVGKYKVKITNSRGEVVSNEVLVSLDGVNLKPTPTIMSPIAGKKFKAGEVIAFSGEATDPEEGALAAGGLSWTVRLVNEGDVVKETAYSETDDGEFTIPVELDPGKLYEVEVSLSAADGAANTDTVERVIAADTTSLYLDTEPQGLFVRLNNDSVQTPSIVRVVKGSQFIVSVTMLQPLGDDNYSFVEWEQGGGSSQVVTMGDVPLHRKAIFLKEVVEGVEDLPTSMIHVWPNPATDRIVIDGVADANVRLVDLAGRTVFSVLSKGDHLEFRDVPPPGVYVLEVEKLAQFVRRKLIIR